MATEPEIENCPICQDELKDDSTIRTLPCNHKFHQDCIQKWIEMRNLCPLCKQVADTSQPVRELDDDRTDLTQQMIDNLIHGSINQSGINFWMQMLQGIPMSSIGGIMIRNRLSRQLDGGEAEIIIEDVFSGPFSGPFSGQIPDSIQNLDLFGEFGRLPFEFTGQPQPRPTQPSRPATARRPIRVSGREGNIGRYSPYSTQSPTIQPIETRQTSLSDHSHADCPHQAQCANCYVIGCTHIIKRCGRCRQIRYCSRECQEANWPQHRDWCNAHRQQNREEKKEQ